MLFLLLIFRDEVSQKLSHYGGPLVFTGDGIDELRWLIGTVDGAVLECFKEQVGWQWLIFCCSLRQNVSLGY